MQSLLQELCYFRMAQCINEAMEHRHENWHPFTVRTEAMKIMKARYGVGLIYSARMILEADRANKAEGVSNAIAA